MSGPPVRRFVDETALADGAAEEIVRSARNASRRRGRCTLVLAGGSTPRGLYETLSNEPYRARIDWSSVEVFWGDERCVPPDDPQSNYGMAQRALLSRVGVRPAAVHRIPVECGAERAAAHYEQEIKRTTGEALPRFDLVLLGMGSDGHTASLFPGTPRLIEERRLVVPAESPSPPRTRVTLTLRTLNVARRILFLVAGTEKAPALARVIGAGTAADTLLPAALVRPRHGSLLWLVDCAAAGELTAPEDGAR